MLTTTTLTVCCASLGPEAALGSLGGALGTWASTKAGLGGNEQKINTLSGMSAAMGRYGLHSLTSFLCLSMFALN